MKPPILRGILFVGIASAVMGAALLALDLASGSSVTVPYAVEGDVFVMEMTPSVGASEVTFTVEGFARVSDGYGSEARAVRIVAPDYLMLPDFPNENFVVYVDPATRDILQINATIHERVTGNDLGLTSFPPPGHTSLTLNLAFSGFHLQGRTFHKDDPVVLWMQGVPVTVNYAGLRQDHHAFEISWAVNRVSHESTQTLTNEFVLLFRPGDAYPERVEFTFGDAIVTRTDFRPGAGAVLALSDGEPPRRVFETAQGAFPEDGTEAGPAFPLSRALGIAKQEPEVREWLTQHPSAYLVKAAFDADESSIGMALDVFAQRAWTLTWANPGSPRMLMAAVEESTLVGGLPRHEVSVNKAEGDIYPPQLIENPRFITVAEAWNLAKSRLHESPRSFTWTVEPIWDVDVTAEGEPFAASWSEWEFGTYWEQSDGSMIQRRGKASGLDGSPLLEHAIRFTWSG